ncbi:MAG: hypothetical protein KF893_12970 [Caldilineaceae bacterium]|nr:hypothetical protein [Caldilineaceae bacterium]
MRVNTAVNHLGNAPYQILVIRFLVDGQGQLQQGVVVDLNERPVGHFRQLEALPGLVADWLRMQEQSRRERNDLAEE